MSLYSNEIRRYLNTRDWPKGLIFDVCEKFVPEPHLSIVFFRDNWLTLDGEDMLQVTHIVKEVMARLWADGIPTYVGKMESSASYVE